MHIAPKGLAVAAKSLHHAELLQASMSSSLDTLSKLGEKPPREISDPSLKADMLAMNEMMRNTSDDYILNMQEKNNSKRIVTTLKLYSNLAYVLHFVKPSLICAVSLRMVELKMAHGLIHSTPGAFALYGGVLVAAGNIIEGCRFGMYLSFLSCLQSLIDVAQPSLLLFIFNELLCLQED